jgi:hypothetical protein
VFVETNWLFACAAPAHHQVPAAVELLDRAKTGEFILHLPNLCIGEARHAIRTKCQPRTEANALRRFITYATAALSINAADATIARTMLDKYESSIKADLDSLDDRLNSLANLPYVNVFSLDEDMLALTTGLAFAGITPKPFDQAILASILVSAERLWENGERGLSFCETDSDLQPWSRSGDTKTDLRAAYDNAHVWVYGDFTLTQPARKQDFL